MPLALVFVLMALVSLAPQTVVMAVNEMVDEFQVEARELEMSWFPLTLRATGLQVAMPGLHINGSELMVRLRWRGLSSERPCWSLVDQRVAVLPQPWTATSVAGSAEAGNAGTVLPLELLLAFEKVLVEELRYADRVATSVQAVREDGRLMLEVAVDSNQPTMIADLRLHSGLSIGAGITLDIQAWVLQVASEGQPRVQFDFDAGRVHRKPVQEFEVALSIARADVPDALQDLLPSRSILRSVLNPKDQFHPPGLRISHGRILG